MFEYEMNFMCYWNGIYLKRKILRKLIKIYEVNLRIAEQFLFGAWVRIIFDNCRKYS